MYFHDSKSFSDVPVSLRENSFKQLTHPCDLLPSHLSSPSGTMLWSLSAVCKLALLIHCIYPASRWLDSRSPLPSTSCLSLGKLPNFSALQFPVCKMRIRISPSPSQCEDYTSKNIDRHMRATKSFTLLSFIESLWYAGNSMRHFVYSIHCYFQSWSNLSSFSSSMNAKISYTLHRSKGEKRNTPKKKRQNKIGQKNWHLF